MGAQWDSPSPSHHKHQPEWANVRRWKETQILSASDPSVIELSIFAKILPTFQPQMPVQAKTWFPNNEIQKSPILTNDPLWVGPIKLSDLTKQILTLVCFSGKRSPRRSLEIA